MKIKKNYNSYINAWKLAVDALNVIEQTLLDNRENNEKVIDAYYLIMETLNRWNDEIKKFPF